MPKVPPRLLDVGSLVSEAFFQRMEEAASGTLVVDANGVIVWIDAKYGKLLGVDPSQAVGRQIAELLPTSRIPEVLETGKPIPLDLMKYREGWRVVSRFPALDAQGQVQGAFGFVLFTSPAKVAGMVDRYQRDSDQRGNPVSVRGSIRQAQSDLRDLSCFCGDSSQAQLVRQEALHAAGTPFPVIIWGPSGVGKKLLAEGIYKAGRRTGGLSRISCAGGLANGFARLGGDLKGQQFSIDRWPQDATVLFENIEDLSPDDQRQLVRSCELNPRARIIVTSRNDPHAGLASASLLPELFWVLQPHVIHVPALSERPKDVDFLSQRYLDEANAQLRKSCALDNEGKAILRTDPLPGNARQLKQVILCAVLAEGKDVILPERLSRLLEHQIGTSSSRAFREGDELAQLQHALEVHKGNMTAAARALGMSRTTLYTKAQKLGLSPKMRSRRPRAERSRKL